MIVKARVYLQGGVATRGTPGCTRRESDTNRGVVPPQSASVSPGVATVLSALVFSTPQRVPKLNHRILESSAAALPSDDT